MKDKIEILSNEDESQFGEKAETDARSQVAVMSNDLYSEDLIVKMRAEQYSRSYGQLQRDLAKGDSSCETLDFKRFSMRLELREKGSLYTIACYAADLLEPFELSVFGEMICRNPDSLVIDIGANYGLYTLYACDLARYNIVGKVVAVEPDRRVFNKLSESVRENRFGEVAILINKAASDRDGQWIDLFVNANGSVDNRTIVDGGIKEIAERYQVETVTVDSIVSDVEKIGLEPKSIIVKIDIQGNEPLVIRGMAQTLANYDSVAVMFEYMPTMMEAAGFDPFEFAHEVFATGFSKVININEIAQSLQPLDSVNNLARVIRQHKSMGNSDPRRYTNVLCYRDMKGPRTLDAPAQVNTSQFITPETNTSAVPIVESQAVSSVARDETYISQVLQLCKQANARISNEDGADTLAFLDQELTECRARIDRIVESDPDNEEIKALWKVVDTTRKQLGLPYIFPAGLGKEQMVDGISGLLSAGDLKALQYCIVNSCGKGVNIGVFNGLSTYYIAKNNPMLEMFGVDAFRGMSAQLTEVNYKQVRVAEQSLSRLKNAHIVVGLSSEVAKQWLDEIGFLFIDGDHFVNSAVSDFRVWSLFVSSNGLIAVHDAYGKVSQSILKVRQKGNSHGPDIVCRMMEDDPNYEFVMVSGCTEVWRKKFKSGM